MDSKCHWEDKDPAVSKLALSACTSSLTPGLTNNHMNNMQVY